MLEFQQARIAWIDQNHYTQGTRVAVVERAVGGEGTVTFEVGEGETALRFKLTESGRFPCIKQKKAADGVILHFDRDQKLHALHLVELKSKVSANKWLEIKAQLQGALHNAHALLGVLGLDCPQQIVCHTAYKQDALSQNPALLKSAMGVRVEVGEEVGDWISGVVKLDPLFAPMRHQRHQRDALGDAHVHLQVRLNG